MRRVRIFKARGLHRIGLIFSGRGLWCVECSTCPDITITFRTHARAVLFVGSHLNGHAKAEELSTRIGRRLSRDLPTSLLQTQARINDQQAREVLAALNEHHNGGTHA